MRVTNHEVILTNIEIVILERAALLIMNDEELVKRLSNHPSNVDFTKEIIEGIYKKAYEIDSKLD